MKYYKALQIEKSASQAQIKESYRRLAKQYHPDSLTGDESKFKEIASAYEVLGNKEERLKYDRILGSDFENENPFGDWFKNEEGSFSNMFNNAFSTSAKGPDVSVRLLLTYEEAYHGTSKRVNIGHTKLNVNIPKGVHDGMQLKITGKGRPHPANSSAPSGDLIVIINLQYDERIVLNGRDIYVEANIPFYDMILGSEIEVTTPFYTIKVNVPPGSQNNKILRISGKGFPIYSMNTYGNLMIKLNSYNPPLKNSQLNLIKKIKKISDE